MGWLLIYLGISILLGEALIYNYGKAKQRTPPLEYIIIITVWPLCIVAAIIMKLRRK